MSRIWKSNGNVSSESSSVGFQSSLNFESASELSYLKAQVWSLEHRLIQSQRSNQNLEESFRTVANEKYELIQQLTAENLSSREQHEELQHEISRNSVLMDEIELLRQEAARNRALLEKVVTQNVELKESIMHANDTIQRMGLIYLKLKDSQRPE